MADLHASREEDGTVKVSLKRGSSACADIVKGLLGWETKICWGPPLKLFTFTWRRDWGSLPYKASLPSTEGPATKRLTYYYHPTMTDVMPHQSFERGWWSGLTVVPRELRGQYVVSACDTRKDEFFRLKSEASISENINFDLLLLYGCLQSAKARKSCKPKISYPASARGAAVARGKLRGKLSTSSRPRPPLPRALEL